MTDSPINLDEARGIIAVSKTRHANGNGTTTDIDYRYLERIVSELEAGRKRIADLEDMRLYDPVTKEVTFRNVIIPQAKDAKILQNNLEGVELAQKLTGLSYRDEIELLKRYLAAIEGAKP